MNAQHSFVAERSAAQHCPQLLRRGPDPVDLLPALARVGGRFARSLAPAFAGLLSGEAPTVAIAQPTERGEAELIDEVGPLAANCLLATAIPGLSLLASIDGQAALRLVDRAFGGKGEASGPLPDAFPLSAELMINRLEEMVARALGQALGQDDLRVVKRDHRLAELAPFPAGARLAVLPVEVMEGARKPWKLLIALPLALLPKLLGNGDSPATARPGAADPAAAPFAEVPLPLTATLVDMAVPLESELWKLLFLMIRIGAALFAAPFFSATAVPVQLRVAITGAIAVLVAAWNPVSVPPALFSAAGFLAIGGEVVVGLALGFVLQLSFAAPVIAAEQIGGAMGMSIAASADPINGAHSPVLGQYFTVMLTLIFLGLGAHLTWLRLVVESYHVFPPGAAWLGAGQLEKVIGFASQMFMAAVAIALPVTLVLLLVQVASGVLSRSAPALNLFALGLPAGILAGLAALIAVAPLYADQFASLSEEAVEQAGTLFIR